MRQAWAMAGLRRFRVRPSRRWVQILQILERQVTEETDGVTGAAGAIGTLTPVIAAKSNADRPRQEIDRKERGVRNGTQRSSGLTVRRPRTAARPLPMALRSGPGRNVAPGARSSSPAGASGISTL